MPENHDSRSDFLFVTLIVPDTRRRRELAAAIAGASHAIAREFDQPMQGDLSKFARLGCDIAIVDLDDDIDQAVRVIESICGHNPSTTVMAYSATTDLALVRRAMQAGARDFLTEPLHPELACGRRSPASLRAVPGSKKASGKLLVLAPCKASSVGVTSVATNFAIALTKESGARVVVVDLDLRMGRYGACSRSDAFLFGG